MGEAEFQESLRARCVMHEEEVDHIAVDADKALGGIGDNWREADDEGDKGDGAEAEHIQSRIIGAMATIGTVCRRMV